MPVYSEYLREPTQQDQDALAKLYPNDAVTLIDAAKQGRLLLIGGRFNGSLISALTLTPIHSPEPPWKPVHTCRSGVPERPPSVAQGGSPMPPPDA